MRGVGRLLSAQTKNGREISGTLWRNYDAYRVLEWSSCGPEPGQGCKLSLRPGSPGSGSKVGFYVNRDFRMCFLDCLSVPAIYRPPRSEDVTSDFQWL